MEQFASERFGERFDVLIVGAGSTGAVLANRLSEDAQRRVLLLEAGPDTPASETIAAAVRNANQPAVAPGLNWKIRTFIKAGGNAQAQQVQHTQQPASIFDYEAGKIVGGSSAVNAVQALRGNPDDYDGWARDCPGWSWADVLPYFRTLEDDPIGPDTLHGRGGPMPIRRERKEELRPLQASLMEACIAHGFSETSDHNNPDTTGVGIIPKNVVDGVRMSTALTYLRPARSRPNLHIATGAYVHKLIWRSTAVCDGVEVELDGQLRKFFAQHVIVCAGAMSTPAILMRSGIGNPALLASLDIAVKHPLNGVGENLMDHPVVGIWGIPKPDACTLGEPLRQTLLRYSSSGSGYRNDMHICMVAGVNVAEMFPKLAAASTSASPVSTLAGVTACFNRSASRGYVRITSSDPYAKPQVSINCLGDKNDILPLTEGVRLAWQLLQDNRLGSHFTQILAWSEGMIQSSVALERAVATFVRPSAHACGTAKMGSSLDSGAVVDPDGKVYGTDNLWIADASIMPTIPSAPTHLTSLMIAEKIAAGFRQRNR